MRLNTIYVDHIGLQIVAINLIVYPFHMRYCKKKMNIFNKSIYNNMIFLPQIVFKRKPLKNENSK